MNALPCSQFAMNLPRLELPTPQMRPWLPMCEVTGICQHQGLPSVKLKLVMGRPSDFADMSILDWIQEDT